MGCFKTVKSKKMAKKRLLQFDWKWGETASVKEAMKQTNVSFVMYSCVDSIHETLNDNSNQ